MARTKVFDQDVILEKAMHVFWQKGYNATSAQDLVDNLGISRSSLYDTFGDKHSLFIKALQRYRKERIDPVIKGLDTAEDIEAYVKYIFETVKVEAVGTSRSKGCFMVNSAVELAPVDSEVGAIANSIMHDTEEALCKAIKKGQDRGVFTTKYPARSMARFVFNSLNGFRVTMKFDGSKKMFDDIVNVCLSFLKS
ncbi:TetR/AcrR family transcriptional regulator [Parapedobacter sp. ISTM3]|uniref:Transcriptional regulator, TetR family n=1 Tax=Parapedobacter luteus TaxID=623280 RepID=A0A1T5BCT6_9SPHI|nr:MULTISPECIES: TetR/AcrR family transcriptional regulator [Parapedobacter]MBK1439606.1 TetR/AcrR family transcriptional regulator [Parapedobacter sp. ISTM3]SKB44810.1 transcriptional regulator, TetR family [Parapedobacter luteus]